MKNSIIHYIILYNKMHCLDFFSVSMNFGSDFPWFSQVGYPTMAMGNRPTCQPFSNGHGEVQSQFPSELRSKVIWKKTSKTEDTQPADLSWTRLLRGGRSWVETMMIMGFSERELPLRWFLAESRALLAEFMGKSSRNGGSSWENHPKYPLVN